ncbi:MAG: hypothetical protein K8U57_04760 [Planctomycetes bacterium]|nr:hypothetical protein [Planctomycetota bacterium]
MRNAETILGIIRKRRTPPDWVRLMASRRRKTMVLCRICHDNIHAGRPLRRGAE